MSTSTKFTFKHVPAFPKENTRETAGAWDEVFDALNANIVVAEEALVAMKDARDAAATVRNRQSTQVRPPA